jgi:hypothetical protein
MGAPKAKRPGESAPSRPFLLGGERDRYLFFLDVFRVFRFAVFLAAGFRFAVFFFGAISPSLRLSASLEAE